MKRTPRPPRTRECALARALLLGALLCAPHGARAADSASDIAERARRIVSDPRFQTEHPPFRTHDQKLRELSPGGEESPSGPRDRDPRTSLDRRRDSLTEGDTPEEERAGMEERGRLAREARRARDARRARRMAEAERETRFP